MVGGGENTLKVLVGKPEKEETTENLGVDGRIILKWIIEKSGSRFGLDSSVSE
jgi:hypothetical protein